MGKPPKPDEFTEFLLILVAVVVCYLATFMMAYLRR
jgi:hypothetical protein